MKTIDEAIDYLNLIISQKKEQGKNQFGLTLNIADNNTDIIGYITKYYNVRQIACQMKYCVLRNDYEIIIWW